MGRHRVRRFRTAGLVVLVLLGAALLGSIPILYLRAQPPPAVPVPTITVPPLLITYEVTGAGSAQIAAVTDASGPKTQGTQKLPWRLTVPLPLEVEAWVTAAGNGVLSCTIRTNGQQPLANRQRQTVTCPP